MKVVEVTQYGDAGELAIAERPDPVPTGGRIRVRTSATTVNPTDLITRQGIMAARTPNAPVPIVLGWEFAGEVLDAAPGFEVGQRVVGMYPWFTLGDGTGTYAEIVLADPSWLGPLPDGADEVEAVTIVMNGQTAQQALALGGAQKGDTLLVTGASGAVGGFAVQLAAAKGIHVVAVAATGDEDYVGELGAAEVISRDGMADKVRELYPDGVDAVLDAATAGPDLISLVRDGGSFTSVVDPAQPKPERGITAATVHTEPDADGLDKLLDKWAAGRLSTRVAGILPLDEAAEAHRKLESGSVRGKLVLKP